MAIPLSTGSKASGANFIGGGLFRCDNRLPYFSEPRLTMIVAKAISIESFKVHRIGERRRSNRIGQLRD